MSVVELDLRRQQAEQANRRADEADRKATEANQRVELLASKLRELGIDPTSLRTSYMRNCEFA